MLTSTTEINLQEVRRGLALADARERAVVVADGLAWNGPGAQVEWPHCGGDVGRLTVGTFPTSCSVVVADPDQSAWRRSWHGGFRWCVVPDAGALLWFDLAKQCRWYAPQDRLTEESISGLTPSSFTRRGRLEPIGVELEADPSILSTDASHLVAQQIGRWWNLYSQRHCTPRESSAEKWRHKDTFTRFVAGVLLLRTIEDLNRVAWLPRGHLRDSVAEDRSRFADFVDTVAGRLNSRVLHGIKHVSTEVARVVIRDSYDMDVDFAALDIDPVGKFYEEILGVEYKHHLRAQSHLFGDDLDVTPDRTARRSQGVYYTPRIYADTLARMLVRPRVRAAQRFEEFPVVADIAAGSGELLCAALREMLSEPLWRRPEIVARVLDEKLLAVDVNPLAAQLCALNLLRTAIRYAPEILDDDRRLPPLDNNLLEGDGLLRATLDRLPEADVVLINPPFRAPNRWQPPDPELAIPELAEVDVHPERALAFAAAAIRIAGDGAGLGFVVPSTTLTGPRAAPWRAWIAERMRLDLVVANYGMPFRDVHSYAGLIVGRKRGAFYASRPRTRIVRVSGLVDAINWDAGALLADESGTSGVVQTRVVPPFDEHTDNWVARKVSVVTGTSGRARLADVMGDRFHHGVVPAPRRWGANLFRFKTVGESRVRHELTERVFARASCLRPVVKVKKVSPHIPLWCEPEVNGTWIFVPPGGGRVWFPIDSLQETDPESWALADCIIKTVCEAAGDEESGAAVEIERSAREFLRRARRRHLRFHRPNGYRDDGRPLILASRASVTRESQGQGHSWFAWLNLNADVVPISSLHMRSPRPEFAAALVAWMGLDDLIRPLMRTGQPRRGGSVEFNLEQVAEWLVPDLRADRHQTFLEELYAAFLSYRDIAQDCRPAEALELPEYREVQALASALWREA